MIKTLAYLLSAAFFLLGSAGLHAENCIGFIPSGGGGSFWRNVHSGAAEAGKELGYDIYFRGPRDEDQADIQNAVVAMIRQRGCKAVIIAPGSAHIAPAIARLKEAGIPWIFVDRSMGEDGESGIVSTDNYKAGQLAGEAMARRLHGKGAVLLMRMKRGWSSTAQRESGFAEAAVRKGLTVIDGGYLGTVYGEAFGNGSAALRRHKGKFQGVFAPNEVTSVAMLAALRHQHLAGQVAYIGVDMTDNLVAGVRSGEVEGLIVQAPHAIGYEAVHMAAGVIEQKPATKRRVLLEAVYLDKTNIDSYLP
jgi:ribose transport system substrate-binding protein